MSPEPPAFTLRFAFTRCKASTSATARSGDVLGMVVRQVVVLALSGVVMGSAATLVTGRVIASLLFGVSPSDPLTLAGVSALVLVVAVMASAIPAARAARTDPIRALRGT
jgi:ABC-type antimicrobial peptide transport system permease subunit